MSRVKTPNLKSILNPRDRNILDAESGTNWVPPKPRELLLPYVDEEKGEPIDSIDSRRKKAKEVYDGYGEIIDTCKQMEEEIENECKDVVVTLNRSKHLRIIEALQRVFPGFDGKTITFDMYKRCIKELAAISDQNIPKPTDKGK